MHIALPFDCCISNINTTRNTLHLESLRNSLHPLPIWSGDSDIESFGVVLVLVECWVSIFSVLTLGNCLETLDKWDDSNCSCWKLLWMAFVWNRPLLDSVLVSFLMDRDFVVDPCCQRLVHWSLEMDSNFSKVSASDLSE